MASQLLKLGDVQGLVEKNAFNHLAKIYDKNEFCREGHTMKDFVEWLRDTPEEVANARPGGERGGVWTDGTMGDAMASLCKVLEVDAVRATVRETVDDGEYAAVLASLDIKRRKFHANKKRTARHALGGEGVETKETVEAGLETVEAVLETKEAVVETVETNEAVVEAVVETVESDDSGQEDDFSESMSEGTFLENIQSDDVKTMEAETKVATKVASNDANEGNEYMWRAAEEAHRTCTSVSRWLRRSHGLQTLEGVHALVSVCEEEVDRVTGMLMRMLARKHLRSF